jgi:hypothetical protein
MTNTSSLVSTGNMQRPAVAGKQAVDLSQTPAVTTHRFAWPLGAAPGVARYNFSRVVEFDPQGVARVPSATTPTLEPYIELGLVPARGNSATASSNQAVIQINGITGSARLFRP